MLRLKHAGWHCCPENSSYLAIILTNWPYTGGNPAGSAGTSQMSISVDIPTQQKLIVWLTSVERTCIRNNSRSRCRNAMSKQGDFSINLTCVTCCRNEERKSVYGQVLVKAEYHSKGEACLHIWHFLGGSGYLVLTGSRSHFRVRSPIGDQRAFLAPPLFPRCLLGDTQVP